MNSKVEKIFFKQVNIAPLVVFRIIFGALMLFGVLRFISKGWVAELYINPPFHFTFYGFDWIKVLPGNWMYLPFILMFFASIGILLGAFYRLSTIMFFVCFTYVELLDKSFYLNHYYFVSLISFLLIFLPANKNFSIDSARNPEIQGKEVSAWTIWIIRFQLGIVYWFAGYAKLNSDWLLEAQPLKIWLQAYRDLPLLGGLFASSFLAFAFSWFGCIYDLTIPFFLSLKKTRKFAYFVVIIFHLVTWLLFPIGVFPWVMIFSTLIFFSDEFHQKIIDFLKKWIPFQDGNQIQKIKSSFYNRFIICTLSLYIAFQIAFPFRYLLYPGNLYWSEEGMRFSWRVMLMHKEGSATFYLKDRNNGGEIEIQNSDFLTATQEDQMATQADIILQYANFLKDKFQDTTFIFANQSHRLKNPSVHASIFVSLNGRSSKEFVSKKIDLTQIKNNLAPRTWLEPF
jgi:hypothetical protein